MVSCSNPLISSSDLPNTKCVIILNHNINQYTHYNLPLPFTNFSTEKLKWIRVFEQLHHLYLRDGRRKEFCIKRVYSEDTYLLYSKKDTLIFAVISHKST